MELISPEVGALKPVPLLAPYFTYLGRRKLILLPQQEEREDLVLAWQQPRP